MSIPRATQPRRAATPQQEGSKHIRPRKCGMGVRLSEMEDDPGTVNISLPVPVWTSRQSLGHVEDKRLIARTLRLEAVKPPMSLATASATASASG